MKMDTVVQKEGVSVFGGQRVNEDLGEGVGDADAFFHYITQIARDLNATSVARRFRIGFGILNLIKLY